MRSHANFGRHGTPSIIRSPPSGFQYIYFFFQVSSNKKKAKYLELENRHYYAYESSGTETFQKWLYATENSLYMGNFKQRHFCLHSEM